MIAYGFGVATGVVVSAGFLAAIAVRIYKDTRI